MMIIIIIFITFLFLFLSLLSIIIQVLIYTAADGVRMCLNMTHLSDTRLTCVHTVSSKMRTGMYVSVCLYVRICVSVCTYLCVCMYVSVCLYVRICVSVSQSTYPPCLIFLNIQAGILIVRIALIVEILDFHNQRESTEAERNVEQ